MQNALKYLRALADETRLRLALILIRHELSVNELVSLLEMGQSRVSRHLKILTEAGLLHARRDGLWAFYSVVEQGEARDFLESLLPFVARGPQYTADWEHAQRLMEERTLKTRQFFNTIAEDWDELNRKILGDFCLPATVRDLMTARLGENCKVAVDLGCGTGEVLEYLRPHCQSLIGVDGSPRMLELARRRFGENVPVSLRIGELDHLPLADAEADFACINLVLHHVTDPRLALVEIRRVLKKTGLLLVADFVRHQVEDMRVQYGDRWLGFEPEVLSQTLTQAGFETVETRSYPVNRGLVLAISMAQPL